MQIKLTNVIPAPLAGIAFDDKCLWGKSIEIDTKGVVLVKAASGRGKSTLISFLYSNRRDFSGNIDLDGKNIKEISLDELSIMRQSRLSVVFQELRLFPNLTARENIEVKYRLSEGVKYEEIGLLADKLGMKNYLDQTCGTLSLGQQQRVAIIRALIQPFEFLMMDEPFSHLDKVNAELAMSIITERCKEQNAGMLITSLGEEHGVNFTQQLTV